MSSTSPLTTSDVTFRPIMQPTTNTMTETMAAMHDKERVDFITRYVALAHLKIFEQQSLNEFYAAAKQEKPFRRQIPASHWAAHATQEAQPIPKTSA